MTGFQMMEVLATSSGRTVARVGMACRMVRVGMACRMVGMG